MSADVAKAPPKVTAVALAGRKRKSHVDSNAVGNAAPAVERTVVVTAYDVTFARLADQAGVDAVLVGDSLGMVVQGHQSTLPVTLDEVIYHTRAVARGVGRAHLVADMPFMSYQASVEDGLRAAGRLIKEGGAEAVKIEGGVGVAELVARLTRIGIPVMGHVGMTPQSVHAFGGFKVQGRTADQRQSILADARAVADAGAYAIVVESVPRALGAEITASVLALTIGIGAGAACDGQVLVMHDLLGLNPSWKPRFARQYADLGQQAQHAFAAFADDVRTGRFPAGEETFE
ncbi:MAG: 3-methyl-2-oxobutanoate hydroxymethyltransferase [Deltaproteobacteria bacterium]|nr:3-methyl-2-oxobutanoate hydroxymethyltransferase [Deltaproteobacteria bacterium]